MGWLSKGRIMRGQFAWVSVATSEPFFRSQRQKKDVGTVSCMQNFVKCECNKSSSTVRSAGFNVMILVLYTHCCLTLQLLFALEVESRLSLDVSHHSCRATVSAQGVLETGHRLTVHPFTTVRRLDSRCACNGQAWREI